MPTKRRKHRRFLVIGSSGVGKRTFIDTYLDKQKIEVDCANNSENKTTDENDNVTNTDSPRTDDEKVENEENNKKESEQKQDKKVVDELPGAITDGDSPEPTPESPEDDRPKTPDPFFEPNAKNHRQVIFFKTEVTEETVEDLVDDIKGDTTEFGKIDALIVMFSTADTQSFGMARRFADECKRQKMPHPRVIVQNKVDLLTKEDATQRVPQIDEYVKKQKLRLYRSSAQENFQIAQAVDYLMAKCEKWDAEKEEGKEKKKKGKKLSIKRKGSAARFMKSMSKLLS